MARSDESRSQTVLLVEGNPGDARLVEEVCRDVGLAEALRTVSTGSDALEFARQRGAYADVSRPDLIVLDWHLPNADSEEVLAELNSSSETTHIPVIVTIGPASEREVRNAYTADANACIPKPAGPDELEETIRAVEAFWLSTARLPAASEETS